MPQQIATETQGAFNAKTHLLLVGDWQQREFALAMADIAGVKDWPRAADFDHACALLEGNEVPPELIFLAQPLPGGISQTAVDRLQQLAPLTRLVLVAGTWCEGELRTGSPPSGVIHLYWYELSAWWQAALRKRNAGGCPPWSLPLDHPQAGRWHPQASGRSSNDAYSKRYDLPSRVLIDAEDFAAFESLSSALKHSGIASAWTGRGTLDAATTAATAGIWDGGQLSRNELQRLTNFCSHVAGPVIALLDFPRVEHLRQAQTAGATRVLAKPYIVEELVLALSGVPFE